MPKKKTTKPVLSAISWLEGASAEEIGEALLAVDIRKAGQVVIYIIQRSGPEMGEAIDLALERAKRSPEDTIRRVGASLFDGFFSKN